MIASVSGVIAARSGDGGVVIETDGGVAYAVAEYSPASVKKAIVGRGAALKPQVAFMVQQLLRLKAPPAPADASDGIAIALTHLLAAGGRKATVAR